MTATLAVVAGAVHDRSRHRCSEVVEGVAVPGADGLVLDGRRLWAVRFGDQVSRWWLSADLSSGTPDGVITGPRFAEPVSGARFGDRLAVVNSHLGTGFPPTNPTYEVVPAS